MNITEEEGCLRDMRRKCISMRKEGTVTVTGITEDTGATGEIEKNKSIDVFGALSFISITAVSVIWHSA